MASRTYQACDVAWRQQESLLGSTLYEAGGLLCSPLASGPGIRVIKSCGGRVRGQSKESLYAWLPGITAQHSDLPDTVSRG